MCEGTRLTMAETMTIPGYTIQARLGQGGLAEVYLAVQRSARREVALKVMSPRVSARGSFSERFVPEARLIDQMKHASIVPVYEVGEYEAHHYLAMEYLPGGDLRRRLADSGGDAALAVSVCLALGTALDVAHARGLLHLDIRPGNILFRHDGTPALSDFGIVRALDGPGVSGLLVGSPTYMSPEALKGLDLDGRSDLYSLGIVFYEVLTGRPPFDASGSLLAALKHVDAPLPRLPDEHAHYQDFVDRLTARSRAERFGSGAEAVRALRPLAPRPRINGAAGPPRMHAPVPAAASPAAEVRTPQAAPVAPAAVAAPQAAVRPAAAAASRAAAPASDPGVLPRVLPLLSIAAALGCAAVGVHLIVSSLRGPRAPRVTAVAAAQAGTARPASASRMTVLAGSAALAASQPGSAGRTHQPVERIQAPLVPSWQAGRRS
jgi:serine/threonine-protein kinase PpkA